MMDLTAVDSSAFGKRPTPAFFASSGVAVSPSSGIPDENPWPGPPGEARFAVAYHFFFAAHQHRLRLVIRVEEAADAVDSVASLWPAATWLILQVRDVFGIRFGVHAGLTLIL